MFDFLSTESSWLFSLGASTLTFVLSVAAVYKWGIQGRVETKLSGLETKVKTKLIAHSEKMNNDLKANASDVSIKLKEFEVEIDQRVRKDVERRMEAYQPKSVCDRRHKEIAHKEKEQNAAYLSLLEVVENTREKVADVENNMTRIETKVENVDRTTTQILQVLLQRSVKDDSDTD